MMQNDKKIHVNLFSAVKELYIAKWEQLKAIAWKLFLEAWLSLVTMNFIVTPESEGVDSCISTPGSYKK